MSRFDKFLDWLEERLQLTEIFSFITSFGLLYTPLDTSKRLRASLREAFQKEQPAYTRWPYVLGIVTFMLFIFLVISGILLTFYYQPSPQTAYESTRFILQNAHLGWTVHQVHVWSAHLFFILLLIRLLRFFYHGVYKYKGELVWICGVLLILASGSAIITGNILPWDQYGYWSTIRVLEVLKIFPGINVLFTFFLGSLDINKTTLPRFYILHIFFIPGLILFLFYIHFQSVRKIGLSRIPGRRANPGGSVYPNHFIELFEVFLVLLGIVVTLGILFPAKNVVKADPFQNPGTFHLLWFLLPLYGLGHTVPPLIAGLIFFILTLAVLFLPFLDRSPETAIWKKKGILILFLGLIVFIVYMGYRGYQLGG